MMYLIIIRYRLYITIGSIGLRLNERAKITVHIRGGVELLS